MAHIARFSIRPLLLRSLGGGRWLVEDVDRRALMRMTVSGGGPATVLAIVGGFCAGLAGLFASAVVAIRVARLSPGAVILLSVFGLFASAIPVAAWLLGRVQRRVVVYDDIAAQRPAFSIEQEPHVTVTDLSFVVLDDSGVPLARLVGARLEGTDGRHLAIATHVPNTLIDAALATKLGLPSPRLDTECLFMKDSRGAALGELRRHAELLGGALVTGDSTAFDSRLLLAFALGLETLLPRRPSRLP
jgi:hypothetical protein